MLHNVGMTLPRKTVASRENPLLRGPKSGKEKSMSVEGRRGQGRGGEGRDGKVKEVHEEE